MKVKIAAAYSIPFLTTGGGHGYGTTYAALDNGLDLDLGYFKSVNVDAKANQLIIGGSVTTEDIILPLFKAGKEFRELEKITWHGSMETYLLYSNHLMFLRGRSRCNSWRRSRKISRNSRLAN